MEVAKVNRVSTDVRPEIFKKVMECSYIEVRAELLGTVQKLVYKHILTMPKFKPVQPSPGNDEKVKRLYLHRLEDQELIEKLKSNEKLDALCLDGEIEVSYENYSMQEALKHMLITKVEEFADCKRLESQEDRFRENEIPSGFETIGDIAHLNLSKKQLPFRFLIGQVVLDKNPNIRSVVCKLGQIESQFRFYELECIAGEKGNYETIQSEDKVRFKVDVSRVYWCSKLSTERTRLIDAFLRDGEVLCDMFCGIGPLAVKSAVKRKGLKVVCNDLNPEGFRYCKKNAALNKVADRVLPFNMDAREFLRMVVRQSNLLATPEQLLVPKDFLKFDHCYMNLPVDAVEFLDVFVGVFREANPKVWFKEESDELSLMLPLVHVYGFTVEKEREAALDFFTARIGKALQYASKFKRSDIVCFHNIRDVSGTSHMYSSTFRLPYDVAMGINLDPVETGIETEVVVSKEDIYKEFESKDSLKKQKLN